MILNTLKAATEEEIYQWVLFGVITEKEFKVWTRYQATLNFNDGFVLANESLTTDL